MIGNRLPSSVLCASLLLAALLAGAAPALAERTPQVPQQVSQPNWEQDIQRFEAQDRARPPAPAGVVFVGSSSIRFWDSLARDFPDVAVLNRGFGGSEIRDSTWFADRIILPYRPRQVVLYAGDNDINSGRDTQQVADDFAAFVQRLRQDLPEVRIAYLAIKPSPSRISQLPRQQQANALIAASADRLGVDFIDVATPMLDAAGQPRPELFVADQLHMNAQGYALWREVVTPFLQP
nr:SGNH/GDSL hydrolase family protein [Pseudoxanthomonas dokdonensis]